MRYKLLIAVAGAALMASSSAGIAAYKGDHYTGGASTSVNGEVTPRVNATHPIDKTDQTLQETSPLTMQDYKNGNGENGPYLSNEEGNGSSSNLGDRNEASEGTNFNGEGNGSFDANRNGNANMSGQNMSGQNMGHMSRAQRMSALIGRPVIDSQGEQIGNVVRALDDGLVISTGQFLGMGQQEVMLRSGHVRLNRISGVLVIATDLTRDQISQLPTYDAQPSRNPNALYNVPENEGLGRRRAVERNGQRLGPLTLRPAPVAGGECTNTARRGVIPRRVFLISGYRLRRRSGASCAGC